MRAVVLAALAITSIAAALLGVGALLVTGLVSHMMAQTGQFHGIVFTPQQIRSLFAKNTILIMISSWLCYRSIRKLLLMYPPDIAQRKR
jgi:hypothetical protein